MTWKRLIGMLSIFAFVALGAACDDDGNEVPDKDTNISGGDAGDANMTVDTSGGTDANTMEAGGDSSTTTGDAKPDVPATMDTGPDKNVQEGGWIPNDGPVALTDSQVLITNDAGKSWVCTITTCAGKVLECTDCIDNDGDGLVDWKDPECLGPCDNTEGPALIGGIGGGTSSNCVVDCYFDYGNGAGNDDCWWDHQCDPLEPEKSWGCLYDKTLLGTKKCPATQSKQCTDFCLPYTPNGCDCWGCCTFPALKGLGPGGSDGYVWIGAMDVTTKKGTCTFKDVLDKTKCPRCTPIQACNNPCGKCEICIGKPTLPPECYKKPDAGVPDSGPVPDSLVGKDFAPSKDYFVPDSLVPEAGVPPTQQCPGGEQPCGLPGQSPCPTGYYCISGCCIKIVIN